MKKFEVGKTYSATSIGDHNCIWIFTVTARTESTITIEEKGGETKKHRINKEVSENRGSESVFPFGRYSMCPILSADHEEPVEKTKELTENEVRDVMTGKKPFRSRQWYGSVINRLEENRMLVDEIKVGTGVTEYLWSDRHAYEVVAVKDQMHVSIRKYDHKPVGLPMSNDWELVRNDRNPVINLVKRGNYWYSVVMITPEEAAKILEGNDIGAKIWACQNGFDLPTIIESGKVKRIYHRRNVSFGVASYYYDYEF